jgi:hypothetical protein
MEDVAARIHADLEAERSVRRRRSAVAMTAVTAVALIEVALFGAHQSTAIVAGYATFGVAIGGLWLWLSLWPALDLGRLATGALVLVVVAPLVLSAAFAGPGDPPGSPLHASCLVIAASVGLIALVLGRALLGSAARRFGGGPTLFLATAAAAGVAAIGVSCPYTGLLHLLDHSLGAVLVIALGLTLLSRART